MISKEVKELKEIFEIFANEHRLTILKFLKEKKSGSVGEIADGTGASFKAISKHLLFLAKKGILNRQYDGHFVLYKISDDLSVTTRAIISNF